MSYSPSSNFKGSTSGNAVNLVASATTAAYNLILPSAQGSANTFLENDGAGNLSWASGSASGVSSLNSLVGAVLLAAGSNITLTPSGNTITIASTGGGGSGTVTSVSVITANGFAGTVATATTTPAITITTTITGLLKANGSAMSAAIAGTDYVIPSGSITGTAGNVTATTNSTLTTLSALSLPYSQVTGAPAAITALTGDATATGPGSAALTLATVNPNVGSFTNANITVNAKGLITAASNGSVPAGESVQTFTLTPTNITNQFVTLSSTPTMPANTLLNVIGGPMQSSITDYTVTGANLNFGSVPIGGPGASQLDPITGVAALVSGDILVVQFE